MPGTRPRAVPVRALLACGILYPLLYVVVNDVVAATLYRGYSRMSQAVSELSATGAPTRAFLTATLPVWILLMVAFGIGVWRSAHGSRALRTTGGLLVALAVAGVAWVPFPMTSRPEMVEGAVATNDVGHLVLTAVTLLLILSQIGFGAAAFGPWFRVWSLVSAVAVVVFGVLTGTQAAGLAAGEPTPWMGLYERAGMGAWLLWMAVLAVGLLRAGGGGARRGSGA